MSDVQNVPVFMRFYMEAEPRFLGRFSVDDLSPLAASVVEHSAFYGDDNTQKVSTQYICYEATENHRRVWLTGFEIILGIDGDEMYRGDES